MISLALCEENESLTLPEISEIEGLSHSYAGKLLMILRRANLVRAERGRNGGYTLTRPASRITLNEIFKSLGEPIYSPSHCLKYSGDRDVCVHLKTCTVKDVWKTLNNYVSAYLEQLTLEDVALGRKKTIPRLIDQTEEFDNHSSSQSNSH